MLSGLGSPGKTCMASRDATSGRNKRRDQRFEKPRLTLSIEGRTYFARNWSLGGDLVLGRFGNKRVGQVIVGELGRYGEEQRYPFRATVVRLESQSSSMAIQFEGLSEATFKFLQRYAMDPKA